ncbi:hypothetical protein ABH935_009287 [Catenulispora sp. GAS73]|uniref:hypothetical protein n=1 Tax=Catenulispora sp. GAS73 TaxID=3156269 RepID=UPI0035153214
MAARLGAQGVLCGSFVPQEPIRELSDLTWTRTGLTGERSQEVQRLAKSLENVRTKPSLVAGDVRSVSGWAMLEPLIAGVDGSDGLYIRQAA